MDHLDWLDEKATKEYAAALARQVRWRLGDAGGKPVPALPCPIGALPPARSAARARNSCQGLTSPARAHRLAATLARTQLHRLPLPMWRPAAALSALLNLASHTRATVRPTATLRPPFCQVAPGGRVIWRSAAFVPPYARLIADAGFDVRCIQRADQGFMVRGSCAAQAGARLLGWVARQRQQRAPPCTRTNQTVSPTPLLQDRVNMYASFWVATKKGKQS